MKSLFKLITIWFLLIVPRTYGRDVILVENLSDKASGQMLMKVLMDKFNIPEKLITFRNVKTCGVNKDALMQLCLKADGELEIMKMNKFVVENTLRVFIEAEDQ